MKEKAVIPKTKKNKTAHSFNRLSHRKIEEMKKKKEEIKKLKLSGYCMNCRQIKKMENIREDRITGKVFIGNCEVCGSEIYKKRG